MTFIETMRLDIGYFLFADSVDQIPRSFFLNS